RTFLRFLRMLSFTAFGTFRSPGLGQSSSSTSTCWIVYLTYLYRFLDVVCGVLASDETVITGSGSSRSIERIRLATGLFFSFKPLTSGHGMMPELHPVQMRRK